MSTKRLAIRGVIFNWVGIVVAMVISFVVTPILIRGLGNEAYGIWSIVMSFTSYYLLADLGLRGAATKYISQFEAVNDQKQVSQVIVTSLGVFSMISVAVLLIVGCVAVIFPIVFYAEDQNASMVRWVVMLTGASVCIVMLGQIFDATLVAMKRFDLSNITAIGTQTLQAIMVAVAATSGGGLLAMSWVILAVSVLQQLCRYAFARRALGEVSLSPTYFESKMLRTLLRFGLLNSAHGIARTVTAAAGSIIVGIILGPAMVTFYVIAESLVGKLSQLSVGITGPLMPVASQLDSQGRQKELVHAFILGSRALLALALMLATILLTLGLPLIGLWIGPEYVSSAFPVLCLLVPAMILQMTSNAAKSVLMGMNHVAFIAAAGAIDVFLTLTLGSIFVKTLGLVGMAYAILFAQAVIAGVLIPSFACRVLDLSIWRLLGKVAIPAVAAACPGFLFALTLTQLAPPTRLIHVIVQAFCICVVFGLIDFFICFDKRTRIDILHSVGIKKRFFIRSQEEPVLAANEPRAEDSLI
jgi:O-antigen/teichoic acid export membrane protein